MGFLQRIKYEFSTWKKLTKIDVEFKLTTQSGNVIHRINREISPKKMIVNYNDWGYFGYVLTISKEYKNLLNEMAKNILNDFQKKARKKFNNGLLDSGDYIVKCTWNINPTFEYLTYTEYKNNEK